VTGLGVGLAHGTVGGGQGNDFEKRVSVQHGDEALADGTGGAEHGDGMDGDMG